MSELSPTNDISPFLAVLWCFYPIGILVFFELLFSSDDDDDDEGGGVMSPAEVYQGAYKCITFYSQHSLLYTS